MIRNVPAALVAALLLLPGALFAQKTTPESTALAYFTAMSEGQLEKMSRMMHPEALASFRGMLLPVVELAEKGDEGGADILQIFDGVTSIAQLRKLDDVKFFASFFGGMTTLQPEILAAMKDAEIETLGHVMEGADTAHVVYRLTMQLGPTTSQTEAISMSRYKDGWAVLLTGELEGMAEGLRRAYENSHPTE